MTNEQILQLVKRIPCIHDIDHGTMVCFGDIYSALSNYGLDNQHIIKAKLEELEKSGHIKLVYHDSPGFEDLIIGVRNASSHFDSL